jgi:hypothetical protein
MGYTTHFQGTFGLDRPLNQAQIEYLIAFRMSGHCACYESVLQDFPDPLREAVGLPVGPEGAYFVNSPPASSFVNGKLRRAEQGAFDVAVIKPPRPASGQPGGWCDWRPSSDGSRIECDKNNKFYFYIDWLEYVIEHFLGRWGYVLNGDVSWAGEDVRDLGTIKVRQNVVIVEGNTDWGTAHSSGVPWSRPR